VRPSSRFCFWVGKGFELWRAECSVHLHRNGAVRHSLVSLSFIVASLTLSTRHRQSFADMEFVNPEGLRLDGRRPMEVYIELYSFL
jgi:hypothetical protein